jgi:hypothetical protein
MRPRLISCIVVACPRGFIASLRFSDRTLDEDIAAETRWAIYERIERKVEEKLGDLYAGI